MLQEVGDASIAWGFVHTPDLVLDNKGRDGDSGPGQDEQAKPVLQGVLMDPQGPIDLVLGLSPQTRNQQEDDGRDESEKGLHVLF